MALIAPPVGRLDDHHRREQQSAVDIAAFGGVGDHRQPLAGGGLEVERELVEKPLHPQQGRDVGFVIDAAGHVQELMEAPADELVRRDTRPGRERGVDLRDAPVGPDREIAARSVLE